MKEHWEKIYSSKNDQEVSWYQESPNTSIQLIEKYSNDSTDEIIDIGGGNSNLISSLHNLNFTNLSVLDISKHALERTGLKLGENAKKIQWIESNILDFSTKTKFKVWHDRAVFHFLTHQEDKIKYKNLLVEQTQINSTFILATFSKEGPIKCSGLNISQYDIEELKLLFNDVFELQETFVEDHTTPFDTQQNFIYSVWKKRA